MINYGLTISMKNDSQHATHADKDIVSTIEFTKRWLLIVLFYHMILMIRSKYTALLLFMNLIYGAPNHISTTSCYVKQLKGKPVSLFQRKHFLVPRTFYAINPFLKCNFIPLFVKVLYYVFLWYFLDHLGPKISVQVLIKPNS